MLDLLLAGPKLKPAPVTTMFDAAVDQEIVVPDGEGGDTRIFIPGGALPVTGNVIVHITPLAGVRINATAMCWGWLMRSRLTPKMGGPSRPTSTPMSLSRFTTIPWSWHAEACRWSIAAGVFLHDQQHLDAAG